MIYTVFDSQVGQLIIASEGTAITHLEVLGNESNRSSLIEKDWIEDRSFFHWEIDSINKYLDGEPLVINRPLKPEGTEFQKKVWDALQKIEHGTTISYSTVARWIGQPTAHRAVASAIGKNPIALLIPCHRVIRSNGELGGFAFGLSVKKELLQRESKRY